MLPCPLTPRISSKTSKVCRLFEGILCLGTPNIDDSFKHYSTIMTKSAIGLACKLNVRGSDIPYSFTVYSENTMFRNLSSLELFFVSLGRRYPDWRQIPLFTKLVIQVLPLCVVFLGRRIQA